MKPTLCAAWFAPGRERKLLSCVVCSRGWALRTRVTPGLSRGSCHSGSRGLFLGLAAIHLRLGFFGLRQPTT